MPSDEDGQLMSELDIGDVIGFMRGDMNSFGIAVVDAIYGKHNLLALEFGFNLGKPGPVLKYSMPHSQVLIVKGNECWC